MQVELQAYNKQRNIGIDDMTYLPPRSEIETTNTRQNALPSRHDRE